MLFRASLLLSTGLAGRDRGDNSLPMMPKNTFLTKCAKFLYLSAPNLAWNAYSGHSGVRGAPLLKKSAPLQENSGYAYGRTSYLASPKLHTFHGPLYPYFPSTSLPFQISPFLLPVFLLPSFPLSTAKGPGRVL